MVLKIHKKLHSHVIAGFVSHVHTPTSGKSFAFVPNATNDPLDVTAEPAVRRYTFFSLPYGKVSEE